MVNINFVPDEYVQQRQSCRANLMYLVLFAAMMGAIGVTFFIIKMRQKAVASELVTLNSRMAQAHQQFKQLELLQAKRKAMMKTLVMTSELIDPVPKSILLACLTNNLPAGVSLLEINVKEKEGRMQPQNAQSSQYKQKKSQDNTVKKTNIETHIAIRGIAPSDIEVAGYIAELGESILLDNVELVESKEYNIEGWQFREFKLKAMIKKDILLSKDKVESIKQKRQKML